MHDPLRHDHDNAGRQGPFVELKGLLGGLFRRPSRPVDHTPEQHGPSVFRAPDVPPKPQEARTRSWQLPWWLRNIRLVMVLAFALFGLVINVFDGQFDSAMNSVPEPTTAVPRPSPLNKQGQYHVTFVRFEAGEWARFTGANGESMRWKATRPAVRKVLAQHQGKRVLAFWRLEDDGLTHVVGVFGDEGSVPPDAPT